MPANRAMEHPAQRHSINDAAEARKDLPNPIPAGNDAQHTADNVLIDLHTESQRDLLSNAGTTPASIAPFHCHYGIDEVFVASLRARPTAAPRRKQHADFRWRSTLWRCSRVEGFRTMAERTTRDERGNRVHKPAMIRSVARRLGARLRPRLRMTN